jgi:acyl-CoA hydrolase
MHNPKKKHKRAAGDSMVEMTELVLPNDTNLLGNLLGGRLMHWIDIAGGMCASRHSNHIVVTAAVDNLAFHHPVKLGELVNLKAHITWTGNTSMEVLVKVYAEDTLNGHIKLTNEAFLTFVAVDINGKPTQIPGLLLHSSADKIFFEQAENRRKLRLKIKKGAQP